MTDSGLEAETEDLLTQVAEESEAFDSEEVTVEELIQNMAKDYLVVLKLRRRAMTEPSCGEDSNGDQLSGEVAAKQEEYQRRILDNI